MAMSGMQVAVVAPTTLLARQHYRNFSRAARRLPDQVGRLSRLVSSAEAKKTKEGLEEGQIDIVIGTHAILAKA
jgi:transcription-repair coupling factor (superfamily II helicase)